MTLHPNRLDNRKRRLRVLHLGKFYPPHRGGMETHLKQLCNELQNHVDLRVLVANDTPETEESLIDGVPVTRLGTALNLAATQFCPGLMQAIRNSPADIVHIHWPNPSAVVSYLLSRHPGQLIFTYHSDVIRQKALALLFNPILNSALRRSAGIIVSSPNYIASSPILSRHRERCVCIPFGLPLAPYNQHNSAAVARIREQFGGRLILAVGRQVYYKGFTYLVEAMKTINGRLLLIGEGPLRSVLQNRAEALGIADRVVFLTSVSDEELLAFYHAVDVFVLPSIARSEAFGLVQIEAMAAGKPVVNTNLDSGVPFVSLHEITGITVPPQDVSALSAAIQRILDNKALQEEYGLAARRRAQEVFSLEKMVDETLKLYGRAVNEMERDVVDRDVTNA